MMEPKEIRAQASRRKLESNKNEYRYIPTLSAEGITVEGDGMLTPKLAKALIEAEYSPDYLLSSYRGNMLCLMPATLIKWASGKAGKGEQPEWLRKGQE